MRKKIQRSMVMVLAVTLLLSYAIITIITYNRNMGSPAGGPLYPGGH